jgi:uncharacterized membrane protein
MSAALTRISDCRNARLLIHWLWYARENGPIWKEEWVMDGEATTGPRSRPIAALTYLLGFVTGVIFLYLEPYDKDEFVRFHARQSIVYSIACFVVNIILSVFIAVLPSALGGIIHFLQSLINLGFAIFWVFLMYKAYSGERYRIPELADWADSVGF